MYPKVSIVIVNFKGTEALKKCLRSVFETEYPDYEVIVVDSLTDNVEKALRDEFGSKENLKIIHFDSNIGASGSHNVGAMASDPNSKYLVFLDNDVEVEKDWLKRLVETAEESPRIGCVQAKVISKSNEGRMDHAGLALDLTATWLSTYGFREEIFQRPIELFVASSAALLTPRELYFKVGGFDSSYFIYDDDTDYTWRVRLQGYISLLETRARVYHEDKISSRLRFDKLYFGYRNRLQNIVKNMDAKNMVVSLLVTLYLGYLVTVLLALAGRIRETAAYFLSSTSVVFSLPRLMWKRKLVSLKRRVPDSYFEKKGFLRKDLLGTIYMTRALLIRSVRKK
ncbi:glycosyltransferase family 2 protein [Thermofilum pendens]|uniref:Glycosyl transferase, family 2 n=1 Tax=Thermofilum pendens (strain DSM 2475 / Hrk 5) TaxID=368408 RepID=A1RWN5_THEPD|nr:glycosyltransferase family 2 protein [Thermofilum pendens]ABL77615.1 glycosyl transferase, family 2 [Thermofilum pendens Hrk 5]